MTGAVHGWRAIARVLGVTARSAQRWASEAHDPLPVRVTVFEPWAIPSRLLAWQQRRRARASGKRDPSLQVVSFVELCALLGRTENTAHAYAAFPVDPLPVEGLGTSRPWAYVDAVRDWIDRQDRPYQARVVERQRLGASQRERLRGTRDPDPNLGRRSDQRDHGGLAYVNTNRQALPKCAKALR